MIKKSWYSLAHKGGELDGVHCKAGHGAFVIASFVVACSRFEMRASICGAGCWCLQALWHVTFCWWPLLCGLSTSKQSANVTKLSWPSPEAARGAAERLMVKWCVTSCATKPMAELWILQGSSWSCLSWCGEMLVSLSSPIFSPRGLPSSTPTSCGWPWEHHIITRCLSPTTRSGWRYIQCAGRNRRISSFMQNWSKNCGNEWMIIKWGGKVLWLEIMCQDRPSQL